MVGGRRLVQSAERIEQIAGRTTAGSRTEQRGEGRGQRSHRMVMMVLEVMIHAQMIGCLLVLQQRIAGRVPLVVVIVVADAVVVVVVVMVAVVVVGAAVARTIADHEMMMVGSVVKTRSVQIVCQFSYVPEGEKAQNRKEKHIGMRICYEQITHTDTHVQT